MPRRFRSPASAARTPPAAAEKGEDEYSQAVAARAVGMLRAMVRALSQALVEEEKALAVKKGGAKPPAAPAKTSPDWVEAPPRSLRGVYQMSVAVGPYTTRAECDAKLPDALQEALDHYAEVCLGGQVEEPVLLPPDQLRQLVKDQWEEVRQYSVGPMVRLHVLLEFDRKVKDRVVEEHKRGVVARRLRFAGVGLAAGLALLGALYGYLKATGTRDGGIVTCSRSRAKSTSATAIGCWATPASVAICTGTTAGRSSCLRPPQLDAAGMVLDFSEIKRVISGWIDENLDHRMILDRTDPAVPALQKLGEPMYLMDGSPTAENIAKLIFEVARAERLPGQRGPLVGDAPLPGGVLSLKISRLPLGDGRACKDVGMSA